MSKLVDPADLIGPAEVAGIIGLSNPRGVSVYRTRYDDFPGPKVDQGKCVLWLRADIEAWVQARLKAPGVNPTTTPQDARN